MGTCPMAAGGSTPHTPQQPHTAGPAECQLARDRQRCIDEHSAVTCSPGGGDRGRDGRVWGSGHLTRTPGSPHRWQLTGVNPLSFKMKKIMIEKPQHILACRFQIDWSTRLARFQKGTNQNFRGHNRKQGKHAQTREEDGVAEVSGVCVDAQGVGERAVAVQVDLGQRRVCRRHQGGGRGGGECICGFSSVCWGSPSPTQKLGHHPRVRPGPRNSVPQQKGEGEPPARQQWRSARR